MGILSFELPLLLIPLAIKEIVLVQILLIFLSLRESKVIF